MITSREVNLRIDHNLTNHQPISNEVVSRFEQLRDSAKGLSHLIVGLCPDVRERDLALEAVEHATMLAVASIARNQSRLPITPDSMPDPGSVSSYVDNTISEGADADTRACTCPSGSEEGSYVPSEDCRVHGVFFDTIVSEITREGIAALEAAASEALKESEIKRKPVEDVALPVEEKD